MSSDNKNITPRLVALANELGGADSILQEAEIEVFIYQRKDEAITLMEKLPDILQRVEQELRELKDLPKHDKDTEDVIKLLEAFVVTTRTTIRFIEGEIGKLEKK